MGIIAHSPDVKVVTYVRFYELYREFGFQGLLRIFSESWEATVTDEADWIICERIFMEDGQEYLQLSDRCRRLKQNIIALFGNNMREKELKNYIFAMRIPKDMIEEEKFLTKDSRCGDFSKLEEFDLSGLD